MTAAVNPYKVGDILSATWGYSMCMVDFYKVLKVTKRTVTLAHIGERDSVQTGFLCGTVMPDPDVIRTEPDRDQPAITDANGWTAWPTKPVTFVRRVSSTGQVRGHNSSAWASKWDGKPCYFNHCD